MTNLLAQISNKTRRLTAAAAIAAGCAVAAPANAAILADIMWIVDISGSMGDDIAQVKNRIAQFDGVMTSNGIDARYGLVRFGGTPTLSQDLTTFTDFTRAGGPFQTTSANGGGTEDGSLAIQTSLGAAFREGAVRNLILVTDEDDDNAGNRAALDTQLAGTTPDELINIIGNPGDDSNSYYRNLAPANGGLFFNILDFRANPQAFFDNFIQTKVREIVVDFCTANPNDPQCQVAQVPVPAALPLLLAGLAGLLGFGRRNRRGA